MWIGARTTANPFLVQEIAEALADTSDSAYKETISQLRAKIDVIDENLIHTLAQCMEISRRIGESKRENKIAILQTGRWEAVLADVVAKGKERGLDPDFVKTFFNAIHEASIKAQE